MTMCNRHCSIRGLLLLTVLVVGQGLYAQQKALKKGHEHYDDLSYYQATLSYEQAFAKGAADIDAMRRLADSYTRIRDVEQAEAWWKKVVNSAHVQPDDLFKYAQVLRSNGKYDEAEIWIDKYAAQTNDAAAARFLNAQSELRSMLEDGLFKAKLRPLSSNTITADLAPALYGNQLVLASSRKSDMSFKKIHAMDGKTFLDLYIGKRTGGGDVPNLASFSAVLNSPYHESNPVFTQDLSEIYFTRNDYSSGKLARSGNGVNNVQLFHAVRKGAKWQEAQPFAHNNTEWSTGQAAINRAGDVLYFVSDRPGGFGGTDLYSCIKEADGTWSEPKNLGNRINTKGNEMTPFLHKDSTLFFASDGHLGLGGTDIFFSELIDNKPTEVFNLGAPINSRFDELSLVMDLTGVGGYLSTNRTGGAGDDDVYRFEMLTPFNQETFFASLDTLALDSLIGLEQEVFSQEKSLFIQVVDGETGDFLAEAQLMSEAQAAAGAAKILASSDENGYIKTSIPFIRANNGDLLLVKEGYIQRIVDVGDDAFITSGELKPIQIELFPARKGLDLALVAGVEPIYFDFEKWHIRSDAARELDRIVEVLKQHPKMQIELVAHTDSRGGEGYNDVLSSLRANATEEYLLGAGVLPNRISSRGVGETQPANRCINGIKCSEEEHAENRRTEFIVRFF